MFVSLLGGRAKWRECFPKISELISGTKILEILCTATPDREGSSTKVVCHTMPCSLMEITLTPSRKEEIL